MQHFKWADLKSVDFPKALPSETIVVLPIGSTEQHGPHLPVKVDTMLVEEVACRAAALVCSMQPISVLPALWISLAEHHMDRPGTLTLNFETFDAVLHCIVGSLCRQGFSRVLLLNGHGGNISALTVIVDRLTKSFGIPVATATYWNVAEQQFSSILEGQPNLRHACEAETSMVMAMDVGLVDTKAAASTDAPREGLINSTGVYRWHNIGHWSKSGVVGVPELANAEKGLALLEAAAEQLATRLTDGSIWHDPRHRSSASARSPTSKTP
jgi:creatinine amidohydrolase